MPPWLPLLFGLLGRITDRLPDIVRAGRRDWPVESTHTDRASAAQRARAIRQTGGRAVVRRTAKGVFVVISPELDRE